MESKDQCSENVGRSSSKCSQGKAATLYHKDFWMQLASITCIQGTSRMSGLDRLPLTNRVKTQNLRLRLVCAGRMNPTVRSGPSHTPLPPPRVPPASLPSAPTDNLRVKSGPSPTRKPLKSNMSTGVLVHIFTAGMWVINTHYVLMYTSTEDIKDFEELF